MDLRNTFIGDILGYLRIETKTKVLKNITVEQLARKLKEMLLNINNRINNLKRSKEGEAIRDMLTAKDNDDIEMLKIILRTNTMYPRE